MQYNSNNFDRKKWKIMKIRFLGAAQSVTGSFFLVETDSTRFAVDCGLFQGPKELQERNYHDFSVDPASIEFLIATHAHIDHTGLIPKLYKNGFRGHVYCTHATEELCRVLLPDSAHIQESEIERKNRKLTRSGKPEIEPIYTTQDALDCLNRFRSINTDEIIKLQSNIEIRMRNAGHILGAAILELWVTEGERKTKVVFSGDLGNVDQPIVKDPTIIENCDYLVIESTYGNRFHQKLDSRSEQLGRIIESAMAKGGNLVIPAFAVERTQDMLYDLISLAHDGKLDPKIQIYIDSPLAIAATEIFMKNKECFDDVTRAFIEEHENPFQFINLNYSRTQEESMALNTRVGNTIIISASGMCEAGRIKHHLKHNLWRSESTVLFVGYQAIGTLGRRLLEGEKEVTIHGEKVAVKANIESIDAYSAHADRGGLINWVQSFVTPPQAIFVVHGEGESQVALADYFKNDMNIPVFIPAWLQEFELGAEKTIYSSVARTEDRIDQAMHAEQKYLDISLKLHEMFKENWRKADYDKIIEAMEKIEKAI